jgi:hypothetical protein
MGVIKHFSSSSLDETPRSNVSKSIFHRYKDDENHNFDPPKFAIDEYVGLPNPKPDNYTIIRSVKIGRLLVILVKYHDCTNYEGDKVMVFRCTLDELRIQGLIDPHFCDNKKYYSPIARFEPTTAGYTNAVDFAEMIKDSDSM